ncbi:unnamed protein product [Prunus armeniaca]
MQKLAKELGVVIPVSFFEEANNAHYNSIAIIDADGADLGLYRKSHILDGPGYQEKFYFNPGDTGFCSSIFTHTGSLSIGVSLNVVLSDWMITILLLGNNAGRPK